MVGLVYRFTLFSETQVTKIRDHPPHNFVTFTFNFTSTAFALSSIFFIADFF
jgi:hypothetical protein